MAYQLIQSIGAQHLEQLVALYRNEWWSAERSVEDVERMLADTRFVFGVVDSTDDALVGFSRVITDCVYRGTVYDVIVREDKRGEKVGRMLLDAVLDHPVLRKVEFIDLNCLPEMVPFYGKWGFASGEASTIQLRRKGMS